MVDYKTTLFMQKKNIISSFMLNFFICIKRNDKALKQRQKITIEFLKVWNY